MESTTENRINECISHLDITYSYQLAKQMETHKTNPVLGFRTAGSDAEHKTGDFLYEEMKRIGLQNVTKDEFWLDSWTFERAVLRFQDQLFCLVYRSCTFVPVGHRAKVIQP